MKKICLALLALLLITGCSPKTTTKVFELTEEEEGYTYTYKHTYTAKDDVITLGTIETISEVLEPLEGEMEAYVEYLEEQAACPYGVLDDEGKQTLYCSKYIDMTRTLDGNKLTSVETIRFEEAAKNKEDIYAEEAGGSYSDNEYYSMEMFTSDLLAEGYTEVK